MVIYAHPGKNGTTLASVLIAVFIICGVMTVVLQCYLVGARSMRVTEERDGVAAALASQLEALRATGYARLPAVGHHPIPLNSLPTLQGVTVRLVVEPGRMDDTRRVTALAQWGREPAHTEKLAIVIAKRGIDP